MLPLLPVNRLADLSENVETGTAQRKLEVQHRAVCGTSASPCLGRSKLGSYAAMAAVAAATGMASGRIKPWLTQLTMSD